MRRDEPHYGAKPLGAGDIDTSRSINRFLHRYPRSLPNDNIPYTRRQSNLC
jgi:hypothetical protein